MKQAHKYNLKATFASGTKWDLNILAVDVSWLFCWINDSQSQQVETYLITKLESNVKQVADDFGAMAYSDDDTLPKNSKILS